MSGFWRFVLTDVDENYAPPERPVLDIQVIDGEAYLRIGTVKDDKGEITEAAQVAVYLDDLYDALGVAYRGDQRSTMRPRVAAKQATQKGGGAK
jgi:hypothetical protein